MNFLFYFSRIFLLIKNSYLQDLLVRKLPTVNLQTAYGKFLLGKISLRIVKEC